MEVPRQEGGPRHVKVNHQQGKESIKKERSGLWIVGECSRNSGEHLVIETGETF